MGIGKLRDFGIKHILIFLLPIIFGLGVIVGNVLRKEPSQCTGRFLYINPSLNCGSKQIIDKSNPIVLEEKLSLLIKSKKESGEVSKVSFYFRDLHNGPALGVNEEEEFIGASLLKLPTTLTVFNLTESVPGFLSRRLHFEGGIPEEEALEQFFKPSKTISPGSSYTVEELLFNSLVYSDNLSNEVLKASLKSIEPSRDLILQTYHDLGLTTPISIKVSDISTRGYASIFRMLYNGSYLSLENSEKVLSMLAQSEFDKGIAAGVPKSVKVSNKFGERFIGEEKQLHDCGIVYFPGNPYLICVMTRGKDFHQLASVIRDISEMVYQEMNSRRIN